MTKRKRSVSSKSNPRQVAVIPVRRGSDGLELCLIRRKDTGKWGIPKGFVDRGDSPQEAALNEAHEEAGLTGSLLGGPIGIYEYTKWSAPLTVSVYLMKVKQEEDDWEEIKIRDRSWHSVKEATKRLAKHPVRLVWDRVEETLAARMKRQR
jgi:8-oxo-dGTP pyrophosphatase MutT (NUDIX family)